MYEGLRSSSKQLYMLKYKDKTIDELQSIVVGVTTKVSALPPNNVIDGYKLLGEADACFALIEEKRQAVLREKEEEEKEKRKTYDHQQKIKDYKRKWLETLEERRKAAILNLPVSSSPNGQLVASIVEELPGITRNEIYSFYEELSAMDEREFDSLLTSLSEEKCIQRNDNGGYVLTGKCDKDLFIGADEIINQHSLRNNLRSIRNDSGINELFLRHLMKIFSLKTEPLTSNEMAEMTQQYGETEFDKIAVICFSDSYSYDYDCGYLNRYIDIDYIDGEFLYCPKMFGGERFVL